MKKILLLIVVLLSSVLLKAQTNFVWEKVDSINKSKSEIYSQTKMYIADKYNSAQDVIQNDDKDAGVIIIKCVNVQTFTNLMCSYRYVYSYTITFKMKDNKYYISISNVHCRSTSCSATNGYVPNIIEPFDGDNYKVVRMSDTPSKKAILMMASLKSELQYIFDDYQKYIIKENVINEW